MVLVKNVDALIDSVEILIGGSRVDRHWGEWLNIWHDLSRDEDHDSAHDTLIGNTDKMTKMAFGESTTEDRKYTIYVPLKFWFNRVISNALPLIALQYHEVAIEFNFAKGENVVNVDFGDMSGNTTHTITPRMSDVELLTQYIYLDSEERKRFAQMEHTYLIEQVQHESAGYGNG